LGAALGNCLNKIDNLQVLRFAAATAVVYAHAVDLAALDLGQETLVAANSALHSIGAAGVDIFFVLSGFIITMTSRGQQGLEHSRAFLWKRFKRVAPIYWLLSTPTLLHQIHDQALVSGELIATFLFWPFTSLTMSFPLLGPGWTLCFEMLFYLAFGAGIAFGGRSMWLIIAAYFAFLTAGFLVEAPALKFLGSPLILEFLLGVLIAKTWRRISQRAGGIILTLGLIAFLPTFILGPMQLNDGAAMNEPLAGLARVVMWGLPAALIVLAAVRLETAQTFPTPLRRSLVFLGDASYAVYLVHTIVLRGFGRLVELTGLQIPGDIIVLIGLIGSVIGGVFVHILLEKPLLGLMSGKSPGWPRLPGRASRPTV